VEHPQVNGLAEAANKVILRGIRGRLGMAKTKRVEKLNVVLWAYRTTPHSTTSESPFRLTYGTEAVIVTPQYPVLRISLNKSLKSEYFSKECHISSLKTT